jgi:hypothetical protein
MKKKKSTSSNVADHASSMMTVLDAASGSNKIVVSGTAGLSDGPFYKLWSQYMRIIGHKIRGNLSDHREVFGEDIGNIVVDCDQYCIVKYTYLDVPPGLMEVEMINNAKVSMSDMYFKMEYMGEFADDTLGFFKYKDIRAATQPVDGWSARVKGESGKNYIMGIDPARTIDSFAISIIELGEPNRLVYVWTSRNQRYSKSMAHVRKLMKDFNIVGIALDATGGTGVTIKDMFGDKALLQQGERPIVQFDLPPEETPDDAIKMLYPIVFTPVWIEQANVLLQKSIEERTLQFPVENLSTVNDNNFVLIDEATDEINKTKRELISIQVDYTTTGRKSFNLKPPSSNSDPDEVVTHKDRYSSLLLANYVACELGKLGKFDKLAQARAKYESGAYDVGGWAEEFVS